MEALHISLFKTKCKLSIQILRCYPQLLPCYSNCAPNKWKNIFVRNKFNSLIKNLISSQSMYPHWRCLPDTPPSNSDLPWRTLWFLTVTMSPGCIFSRMWFLGSFMMSSKALIAWQNMVGKYRQIFSWKPCTILPPCQCHNPNASLWQNVTN